MFALTTGGEQPWDTAELRFFYTQGTVNTTFNLEFQFLVTPKKVDSEWLKSFTEEAL